MKNSSRIIALCFYFLLVAACSSVIASAGGGTVTVIPWKPSKEILEYHSCGSADKCWVAELKNKKTKKLVAKIRCDGEKLFWSKGNQPEMVAADDCKGFEKENKFEEIQTAFRRLLHREK